MSEVAKRMAEQAMDYVFNPPGINAFGLLYMNPRVTIVDIDADLDLIATYGAEEWAQAPE